jgi:hypothetical protein
MEIMMRKRISSELAVDERPDGFYAVLGERETAEGPFDSADDAERLGRRALVRMYMDAPCMTEGA